MNTLEPPEPHADRMLGNSPKMRKLLAHIRKVAVTGIPVLLVGEKGTGRSLAARIIHELSPRHKDPFTRINCNDVTRKDKLIGALFHAGTLFLNQVGALPLSLQATLAQYLDEKLTMPVGDESQGTAGAHLIASIDQHPQEAIAKGRFLDHLHLDFVTLRVPALRERVNDILLLADAFLKQFAGAQGKQLTAFSEDAQEAMMTYPWPGNVRELQNRIMCAAVVAEGLNVTPEDLELTEFRFTVSLQEARDGLEKEWVTRALAQCGGNITRASKELGVTRPTLYDLMNKFGLSRPRLGDPLYSDR